MRASTGRPPKPALGLAWRIFTAMSLVVVAGAGTLLVSALLVARPVFHAHLDQIKPLVSHQSQAHVDEAFSNAVLIALSVGVTAALAAALVVTWLVAKRVAAPVAEAAEAAQRIADGDYQTRLRQPRLGPEFDRLTTAFNLMALRLATTDQTRRHLLADLAHELRTPLASMQATIEAINDGILPSDQMTLSTLTEQSQRLHRLVGDLSAVSRAEERQLNLHPVLVSAQDLVSGAVTAARPRFDAKEISLTLGATVTACEVLVDPDRLAEALGALLDNALRHTATGGRDDRRHPRRRPVPDRGDRQRRRLRPRHSRPAVRALLPWRLIPHRRRRRKRHRPDHRQSDRSGAPRTAAEPQRRTRQRSKIRDQAADRRRGHKRSASHVGIR